MEKYQLARLNDNGGDLSIRWYVEYKFQHPETNKFVKFREWISQKLTTRTTRYQKATEIKNRLNIKLKSGFNPFEACERQKNIREALEEILAIKYATCGGRANSTYKSLSGFFIDWLLINKYGTIKPNELNKSICQKFLDNLLTDKKLSNRTYNNYLVAMRTLFECMFERDMVDFNVWKKVSKLKVKQADISFFTKEERNQLANFLPGENYQLYCVALLIYYCYLRPAEIVRLKISDLDFTKGQIIIKGSQSKNGVQQIVVMPPDLITVLKQMPIYNVPADWFIFATSKQLLPSATQIAPTRIADAWRKVVKEKHGIKKNIYDMKPTGAGEAFENGIDARNIQLQIRHHSLDQTQIYLNKVSSSPSHQIFRDKMPSFVTIKA